MRSSKILLAVFVSMFISIAAYADVLKPFVLASQGAGDFTQKVAATKKALTDNGFEIVGQYDFEPTTAIIIVTNNELKTLAAKSKHGGYGAIQRISVTKVGGEIQVSYTNPTYMAFGYRMEGNLKSVYDQLAAALGKVQEFGAKGLKEKELRKFHYMMGMEYFDEPSTLASYGSQQEALAAAEKGLSEGKFGVTKVYRVDIPGKQETVIGVAMKGSGDEKFKDDGFMMSEIDSLALKARAHLPYEILISDGKIYALYARFRIALNFPDLSMMGKNSFMNIRPSPEAVRVALAKTVGGKE